MDGKTALEKYRPDLVPYEKVYREFHQNPELSKQEVQTASIVASHLEKLGGYIVHQGIGGHGVVGVLSNGKGPTVLLRAELDALPHLEKTGLPYASTKIATDQQGKPTPVMHACGHDLHTATLMAVAELLNSARSRWSGTLICLFQPDEETASGARAMVADGLYDKAKYGIPTPNIVLSQHLRAIKAGVVAISGGPILTAVESLEIRIFGKSGHISRPDLCVDPVLTASQIVVRLQSIVTKEVRPEEFAIIACPSIHGGSTANIVPDYVDLKLSIRAYQPKVHERLLTAVKRVVYTECEASGSLHINEPTFTTIMQAPATINDSKHAETLKQVFKSYFGDNTIDSDPFGASEDVSILATACGAPLVHYIFGCVDTEKWEQAKRLGKIDELPHNHSALFAPVIQPTMRTGVDAFALAAMTFFEKLA